jgi:hypothetical protein
MSNVLLDQGGLSRVGMTLTSWPAARVSRGFLPFLFPIRRRAAIIQGQFEVRPAPVGASAQASVARAAASVANISHPSICRRRS